MSRRKLVIGVVALALAAGAGGAYAATQSAASPRHAFLNDIAKRLHVTPQQLAAAIHAAAVDQLQAAVKAGRLTQAQANAIEKGLKQGGPVPLPLGVGPLGLGLGPLGAGPLTPRQLARPFLRRGAFPVPPAAFAVPPGAFPAPPMLFRRSAGVHGGLVKAAATYLGLSKQQLRSDLLSGKTLAQITSAQGKSLSGLEQAIGTVIASKLQKALSAGFIGKAQEQRILSMSKALIKSAMTLSFARPLRQWRSFSVPAPSFRGPALLHQSSAPAPATSAFS
jgi:hypothetical protein